MHQGQVDVDGQLVQALIAQQHPQWRHLAVRRVRSGGTENAVFRLGEDLAVRLPLHAGAMSSLEKEVSWLPTVFADLPLESTSIEGVGTPTPDYPFPWAVVHWLEGADALCNHIGGNDASALALADWVRALWALPTAAVPPAGEVSDSRGVPLPIRDADVRDALPRCAQLLDTRRAARVWRDALAAPPWTGLPVWLHTDLIPANLLVRHGSLCGVLDFGAIATGDPAYDLTPAWWVFDGERRATYLRRLHVEPGSDLWRRGRGLALSQALIALPYYLHTNPSMVAMSRRAVDQVLDAD